MVNLLISALQSFSTTQAIWRKGPQKGKAQNSARCSGLVLQNRNDKLPASLRNVVRMHFRKGKHAEMPQQYRKVAGLIWLSALPFFLS